MIDTTSDRCMARLQGVEAIDYFLAKELLPSSDADNELLFHLLLALHGSLRQGHTCLSVDTIAGQQWWEDTQSSKPGYRFPDKHAINQQLLALNLTPAATIPVVFEHDR